jgi:RNA polymerase sigma-70 factor (ECF subfamily)
MTATAYCAYVTMESESAQIAHALRRRDPDLLGRLIEQYQHRLFRYLVHFTGDRRLSEDLFQETWLRVLERGKSYDGKSDFAAWLLRLAHNLAVDYFRTRRGISLDELTDPERAAPLQVPDKRPTPYQQAASAEDRERVLTCLNGLPAAYREVVALRFHEDMPLDEIAQVVGVPLATVKSRLYRALELLGTKLEELS